MLNWIRTLDRVLKGDATKPDALRGGAIELPIGGLTIVVVALGVFYGLCMGAFALLARWGTDRTSGYYQILASGAKVPMLFLLTLLVTFPSLYVFNALVGSRLSFPAVSRLMIAALAVIMAVLASFGTILLFFSLCTDSYPFIVLLNVILFAIAGLLGMRFLLQTLRRLSVALLPESPVVVADPATSDLPPPLPGWVDPAVQTVNPQVKAIFRIWVIVFGLVGAQMGWVLRPFIGSPNTPFTFFRERDSNFFEAVGSQIGRLAGWREAKKPHWRSNERNNPKPASYPTEDRTVEPTTRP